jgi:hypothetical protein
MQRLVAMRIVVSNLWPNLDQATVLRLSRLASLAKGVKGRSGSRLDGESLDSPPT